MRAKHSLAMLLSMSSLYLTDSFHVPVSRRQWLAGCSALTASLAVLPRQATATAPEKPRVTLLLDDRSSLSHLPLLLAEQLGFFKAEGIEVEMLEQANHVAGASALSITNPDVLCIPYENALLFKAKGIHMVSLAQIARTPQWVLGVSNKNVPSYKSLADLRGKRMGLIDAEGSAQRCLNFILLRAGMKPSQLNWVNLNSSVHAMVALRNGQVDALFAADPLMTALEKKDDVTVVTNLRTLKQTQRIFSGPLPGNSLLVSQAFAQQHPQTCQALVAAVVRSLKWLRTAGPSDLLRTMVDNPVLPDRLVYLNAIDNVRESFSLDGWLSTEAQQASVRMLGMLDPSWASANVAWQNTARNDFVRQAKQRFRI